MDEPTLAVMAFVKLVCVAMFAFLYARGGMTWKIWRRYVAPFVYGLALAGLTLWRGTFSWLILLTPAMLCGALHLGYGAEEISDKVTKRATYAAATAFSAVPLAVAGGTAPLWALHLCVSLAVIISLGVFNITKSAREEETCIGAVIVFLPLFMV